MLYRKTYTKPIPLGAELFTRKGERFARYTDGKGRTRTARVTTNEQGIDRLVLTSPYWRVRYRNGNGIECDVPTGCRDEVAAQGLASGLHRRAELVKAGTIKPAEDAAADHAKVAMTEHVNAYLDHLCVKGVTDTRYDHVESWLNRLVRDCGLASLPDLRPEPVEKWLVLRTAEGTHAATRNAYRGGLVAFGNWCVKTNRLPYNPFVRLPKADEKADRRRTRRAMTEDELQQLLAVARQRPLLDKMTVRRGKRKGQRFAKLTDATRQSLEHVGRERELIYKAFVLTGLRLSELASITAGNLDLDAEVPYIVLDAADEKNRKGSELPMRDDLAQDIRVWLADKLTAMQDRARQAGEPIPMALPPATPLFYVPTGLRRILDRDLVAAGIARLVKDPKTGKTIIDKRDERGRTIDVHALRHTFASLLSKGGVAPRTAQAAMRHSDIKLTMGVYTDPKLLDVRGALDVLPHLPLGEAPQAQKAKATGTYNVLSNNPKPALASALASQSGNMSASAATLYHVGISLDMSTGTANPSKTPDFGH